MSSSRVFFKLLLDSGSGKVFQECSMHKSIKIGAVEREDEVSLAELFPHRARDG